MRFLILPLVLASAIPAFAQEYSVRIIDRQEHESSYTYSVPGYFSSNTYLSNGSISTYASDTPAQEGSFSVSGATFSLQLPDGRVAIVNCDIKFAERFAGAAGNHRNCRQPITDDIQVYFHGDNAKLEWIVSVDGKKKQSETYKVLGIVGRTSTPASRPESPVAVSDPRQESFDSMPRRKDPTAESQARVQFALKLNEAGRAQRLSFLTSGSSETTLVVISPNLLDSAKTDAARDAFDFTELRNLGFRTLLIRDGSGQGKTLSFDIPG